VDHRTVLDTLIELVLRDDIDVLGIAKGSLIEALVRARALPGSLADGIAAAGRAGGGHGP
jgi:hypothetical protein